MTKLIFTLTEIKSPDGYVTGFHIDSNVDIDPAETVESVVSSPLIQSRILLIGLIRCILAEHFGFILHSTTDPSAQFLTDIETEIIRRQDEVKVTRPLDTELIN